MQVGNSPIKGLEKLGEDLRQERQKATLALQDRAKLRIEVESLKSSLQMQTQELKDCKSYAEVVDTQNLQLQQAVALLTSERNELLDEAAALRERVSTLSDMTNEGSIDREKMMTQLTTAREQLFALTANESALEARVAVKDSQIAEFRAEIESLRGTVNKHEDKEIRSASSFADKARELDEMKARIQQAEILKESYHQHMLSTEEIKKELEKSLANSQFLSQQLRDSSLRLNDQQTHIVDLEAKIRSFAQDKEFLVAEKHDLECVVEELTGRLTMEAEMASTEHTRAEACARSKEFLEIQVDQMREAHASSLEEVRELQDNVGDLNDRVAGLQAELVQAQRREADMNLQLEEAMQSSSVAAEVEHLRAQLNEVRKQLIKRGIDDETNLITPKTALERESHSREVTVFARFVELQYLSSYL